MKLCKGGLIGSGLFAAYSAYMLFGVFVRGQFEAVIFVYIATLPFSVLINIILKMARVPLDLSPSAMNTIEMVAAVVIGLIMYYVIGCFLGRATQQQRRRSPPSV